MKQRTMFSLSIQDYIALIRPRTLTAAVSPVILGFSFAATHYAPSKDVFSLYLLEILLFLVALLSQMAANLWNEYFDFTSGLDLTQMVGNSRSLVKGHISPYKIKFMSKIIILTAIMLGLLLSFFTSLWLIPIGFLAMTIAYTYSGGPYPISRTPFGELAAGIAMGFTLVLVSAFIWAGTVTWAMCLPAIPSMVLVGLILQTNSTRDIDNDQKHGRRTFAILIGRERSILVMTGAYYFIYLWTMIWIFLGALYTSCALACLSIFFSNRALKIFIRYSDVEHMDEAMKYAALTNISYHLLFAIGLWIYPYVTKIAFHL